MRNFALIAVTFTGALLLYATGDFPDWGAVDSPANGGQLSTHYINEVRNETRVPNIVTAILVDYRGFDTMFETIVVFVVGIAIIAVLRDTGNGRRGYPPALANNSPEEQPMKTHRNAAIPIANSMFFGASLVRMPESCAKKAKNGILIPAW